MKKYNLSKIMKRAWDIKKKLNNSFSEALRMSWKIEKQEKAIKEYDCEPNGIVTWNIWMGYNMIRAYYNRSWASKYANNKKNNYITLG